MICSFFLIILNKYLLEVQYQKHAKYELISHKWRELAGRKIKEIWKKKWNRGGQLLREQIENVHYIAHLLEVGLEGSAFVKTDQTLGQLKKNPKKSAGQWKARIIKYGLVPSPWQEGEPVND